MARHPCHFCRNTIRIWSSRTTFGKTPKSPLPETSSWEMSSWPLALVATPGRVSGWHEGEPWGGRLRPPHQTGKSGRGEPLGLCYAVIDGQNLAHLSFAPVRLVINSYEALGHFWSNLSGFITSGSQTTTALKRKINPKLPPTTRVSTGTPPCSTQSLNISSHRIFSILMINYF